MAQHHAKPPELNPAPRCYPQGAWALVLGAFLLFCRTLIGPLGWFDTDPHQK